MRDFDLKIMKKINDKFDTAEDLLEELFPGITLGELTTEMYNAGLIPDDILERVMNET